MAIKAETSTSITIEGAVLIRTVTNYFIGEVVATSEDWVALSQASWVASLGRFSNALATGQLDEVEPFPATQTVLVARGAIVDLTSWEHALPTEVK